MSMERISPQTEECRRKYFAEVAGKMTCLAAMAEIGKDEAIHGSGTQNDHEIAELCALLARKNDQAFFYKASGLESDIARDRISSRLTALHQANLIDRGSQSTAIDYRTIAALKLLRLKPYEEAENTTAEKIRSITTNLLIPHFTEQMKSNTEAALQSKTADSGAGLGLSSALGMITVHSEFYADYYYREEQSA